MKTCREEYLDSTMMKKKSMERFHDGNYERYLFYCPLHSIIDNIYLIITGFKYNKHSKTLWSTN
jgi:hypothetical protein